MLILDTQVLLWLRSGERRLGARARRELEQAWISDEAAVSAITFWEVALLRAKGRSEFPEDVLRWRRELLDQGLAEIPLNGQIGISANALEDFHSDPADRIIVATAQEGHRLVTADRRILDWPGLLSRLDARE